LPFQRKLGGRGLNPGERRGLRDERGQLQKELRQREAAARARVFDNVDVVLCTLSHVSTKAFPRHLKFDLAVIDECSQALEIACWPALLQAPRCVLAGDHLQLPPVIHSDRYDALVTFYNCLEDILKIAMVCR
jgi:superfamily I DNA and/or RNA helicase